jgi:hypothetical protein
MENNGVPQDVLEVLRREIAAGKRREARTMNGEEQGAIERLLQIAQRDTGQSRRVADFLLGWYNAAEYGGWDPTDLWAVDRAIADDMMTVLGLIHGGPMGKYPADWGFRGRIEAVWGRWRKSAGDGGSLGVQKQTDR